MTPATMKSPEVIQRFAMKTDRNGHQELHCGGCKAYVAWGCPNVGLGLIAFEAERHAEVCAALGGMPVPTWIETAEEMGG